MLRVNLISWDNGVGLSRDLALLGDVLASSGEFLVSYTRRGRGKLRKLGRPLKVYTQTALQTLTLGRGIPKYDINIMLEHIWPEYFPWAHRTAFVPNPEWCRPRDLAELGRIDLVLAKTRMAEKIFANLGVRTAFVGFTSADRYKASVPRQRAFFHLAGRSRNKGTTPLLDLWADHPEWPLLTVVQNPRSAAKLYRAENIRHIVEYLPDEELKNLQNAHIFHICPSETEGFGHYIVEAMSAEAVTLTLDAAPMNEIIHADRGVLIRSYAFGMQNLAVTHRFDPESMAQAVEKVLSLTDDGLRALGSTARAWYQANNLEFPERVISAVRKAMSRDHV